MTNFPEPPDDHTGAEPTLDARQMVPALYSELRALAQHYMRAERHGHTLQPTALVHEAYARMVEQERVVHSGRSQFFAMAARVMRQVLVDHARTKQAQKRGREVAHITLDERIQGFERTLMLEDLDAALLELAELDPRQCNIVEMRFFAGLSIEECAEVLNISTRTVNSDWQMARAWLFGRLRGQL
ncbi:MAG: ECF-type sigma factor [Acidobacteriota bacterium]|nr:ECF-type sigma factor [Acidobacteriota bacterium]